MKELPLTEKGNALHMAKSCLDAVAPNLFADGVKLLKEEGKPFEIFQCNALNKLFDALPIDFFIAFFTNQITLSDIRNAIIKANDAYAMELYNNFIQEYLTLKQN